MATIYCDLFRALLAGIRDPRVDRLSSGEAFAGAVPVLDGGLAQLPAQEQNLAFDFAGEV
jgi:hypothetical protein